MNTTRNEMRALMMKPDGSVFLFHGIARESRYAPEGAAWVAVADAAYEFVKGETDAPGHYLTTLGVQFNDEPWVWTKPGSRVQG